ncbi:hypothetical protein BU24DRAFT_8895 [Aaosphaeria arxii CBS 175.79]|uniref:Secreted protein n=1 Tax=Aaosphaeria arxii CBS 175.79 TaxID=1450172 RepID=A0A6A5Y5H6_9PLEO|nr:uncharacterized protein BU24DRAFT_8895 [Aaosphaeria arxii CBS 175.79]KAF2020812.1 hypothetical protein BU24DRAFT_8895 [Aaosphaeria arxii CBS 175.79]
MVLTKASERSCRRIVQILLAVLIVPFSFQDSTCNTLASHSMGHPFIQRLAFWRIYSTLLLHFTMSPEYSWRLSLFQSLHSPASASTQDISFVKEILIFTTRGY